MTLCARFSAIQMCKLALGPTAAAAGCPLPNRDFTRVEYHLCSLTENLYCELAKSSCLNMWSIGRRRTGDCVSVALLRSNALNVTLTKSLNPSSNPSHHCCLNFQSKVFFLSNGLRVLSNGDCTYLMVDFILKNKNVIILKSYGNILTWYMLRERVNNYKNCKQGDQPCDNSEGHYSAKVFAALAYNAKAVANTKGRV